MRIKVVFFVLCTLLLTGCISSFKTETYNDEDIDTQIKMSAQETIDKIFTGIIEQDIGMIRDASLITDAQQFNSETLDYIMKTNHLFKENNPIILQQSYTVSNGNSITVFLPNFDGYACTLPTNKMDAFTSFYTIQSGANNLLIMVNLLKDSNDHWKMSKVYFGEYEIMGKGIEQWINSTNELKDKEYLLSAYFSQQLAVKLTRPNEYMNYLKEDAVKLKYKELHEEVMNTYSFPMKVQLGENEIEIYYIDLIPTKEGYVYEVKYVTKQDITNPSKDQMEEEANFIYKQMKQMILGFGEGFSNYVVYSAFSEPPIDPNKQYNVFTSVIELEK